MAVLSTDTFNRASLNSTDGAGSLDPLAWTNQSGTVNIVSNKAGPNTVDGNNFAMATVDLATADVDLSLTLTTIGATGGVAVMFRFSDSANYWIWYSNSSADSYLFKRVAGSFTPIGPFSGAANGDVMRVVANGSAIEVFRNGTSKTTTTDSFNSTATKHGLWFNTTGGGFSDSWSASNLAVTTTVNGTQATETDTGTSGNIVSVAAPTPYVPTLTYSLDTPSAATAAGYMVLG